ncbi:MAG: O-antigen ligase family protein [Phycisphaerales bacterium]|nr:MAG: O-antigen ligase family protein [Phycisphaerales bacterium]
MTKQPAHSSPPRSRPLVYLEYILLALCLCSLALRATFAESPAMQSSTLASNIDDSIYSLSVSTVLIFSFLLWLVWSLCSGRLSYRPAGTEIGLAILGLAAVAGVFAAADKRLALTSITTLLAPPLMALLLVQILDSQSKVKLVLAVIAALGAVSAYQCAEQFFFSNKMTIEQYEQDPQSLLDPMGIEPGSFQQFMFEHRLYSGGVRGFFTTRNSAGSFALCAFAAAVALFIEKLRDRRSDSAGRRYLLGCGLVAAVILLSLLMTRSKGAIAGLLLAIATSVVLLLFGNRLRPYRKIILAACTLLVIAGGWAIARYGLSHGRLPGGNSMLVRWQYWRAAAKMYADHPIAGVGPGNFTHYYPRYKPAAALESVADPHNFPLSLMTQYGPLGLVGFLAMILIPLWRTTSPGAEGSAAPRGSGQPAFRTFATAFVIVIPIAMLLVRPFLMDAAPGESLEVMMYVIVTMYIAPAAVFVVGFVLLAGPLGGRAETARKKQNTHVVIALSCAVLAVALHNLTDFAIFEPGISTALWAIMACLIATNARSSQRAPLVLKAAPAVKLSVVVMALATTCIYVSYVLAPTAASTAKIGHANQAVSAGRIDNAHRLLQKAGEDDTLSAAALSLDGRLYLHHFQLTQGANPDLLLRAAESLRTAISRNDAAFKDFERLTDAYCTLAEVGRDHEKTDWLNKAFDAGSRAIERYPGCGRLHSKLAQVAEQLGESRTAIEHYKKAIEIEDEYRGQFRLMYPEREKIVSRLGEDAYQLAIKRMRELSEPSQELR